MKGSHFKSVTDLNHLAITLDDVPSGCSSAPPVSAAASAIQLLGEWLVLSCPTTCAPSKQWGAMADLDPRQHPSGSSVSKKPHLSKAGNRYLRIAL